MTQLSKQQMETLASMRQRGLDQPARKLAGLFGQIQERPNDGQLTELIAGMVKQYMSVEDSRAIGGVEPSCDGPYCNGHFETRERCDKPWPPCLDGSDDEPPAAVAGTQTTGSLNEFLAGTCDRAEVCLEVPIEGIGKLGDRIVVEREPPPDCELADGKISDEALDSLDPPNPVDHFRARRAVGQAPPLGSRVNPTPQPKPRLELVPFGFIVEMARVMQSGLEGYDPPRNPGDWQKYTAAELERRRGSLLRHYSDGEWASVAVNAAILWWHERHSNNP